MHMENYLSSIDSSDPLGSTKPQGLRGGFKDHRDDVTAGENLSVQPDADNILQYPNRWSQQGLLEFSRHFGN